MDKQTILTKLNKVYGIAHERQALYSEYSKKINSINIKLSDLEEVQPWQRVIGAVITIIPFILISMLGDTFYISGADEQPFIMKVVYALFFALVLFEIAIQVFMKKIVERTKWYQNKLASLKAEEQALQEKYLPPMFAKVKEGVDAFPELGQKYHTTPALQSMINYIQDGRADTIKEMIEAYELDCHRGRVEAKQDRIMYELEEQLSEINRLSSQVNYVTYYK